MNRPCTPYDHTEIFREELELKLAEIRKLCEEHSIPFFWEFAIRNTLSETVYVRDALTPRPMRYTLKTNTVLQHILVANGYRALAPEDIDEIEIAQ